MKCCVSAGRSDGSVCKGMNLFMSVSVVTILALQLMSGTVAKAGINHSETADEPLSFHQNGSQAQLININLGERTFDIDISAQSLPEALKKLHKQTEMNFAYSSQAIQHIQSTKVRGHMTAEAALLKLLKGTDVKANIVGDGTAALKVAQAGETVLLDGITVYGEKTERDLQETRSSVQVFTSQDIEESSAQTIDGLLEQSSNVTTRFGGEGFAIRGINNDTLGADTAFPLASLYIDGASISRFATRTGIEGLWDVEQVEVFKGPQSTTQGRNTLAGAIIVNTKDPTYNLESAVRAGIGTQNSAEFAGVVNIPLVKDMLAVRIAADFKTTDGFNDNLTLNIDDQAFRESKMVRGKILFEPNDKIKNVLTLSFSRNESGDDEVDRSRLFEREFFGNIQGHENNDQYIATLDSKITLNDNWYLQNITSFNRAEYDRLDDADGFINGPFNSADDQGSFARQNENDTFTEELRLHYQGEKLKFHIGAYYASEKEDDKSQFFSQFTDNELIGLGVDSQLIGFYTGTEIFQDRTSQRDIENVAGFGEFSYDVNNFITVFGGIRYDRSEFSINSTDDREIVTALPNPAVCGFFGGQAAQDGCDAINNGLIAFTNQPDDPGSSTVSDAWLPSAGVTLNWNEDFSTSFFYKRGYRAGGAGNSIISFQPFEYDPEFVDNYEFAIRSQWFDKKLTLNANFFYMDWKDQQVNFLPSFALTQNDVIIVNTGQSTLKGFEVEAYAQPTDQLKLRGSVGYSKAEFEDFVLPEGNFSGNALPNAPEWTIAGSARYSFLNGIYVQADANFRTHAFTEVANDPTGFEQERTIVNAKIGYKTEKIDAYIFSNNLFDEEYVASAFENDPVLKIGDGRSVGVRVNMKLD